MRLSAPSRGTSFYESFSDLIFGTLIIFLVVVLALMLRIRTKQTEFETAIESEIALNRYAGGSAQTQWCLVFVMRAGRPCVAFPPQGVWQQWGLSRHEDSNAILSLCRAVLSEPGVAIFPVETFVEMGPAFNEAFVRGATINPEIGDVLSRIEAVRAESGGRLDGWTPEQLVAAVGGMHAGTYNEQDRPSPAAERGRDAYFAFIAGPGEPLPEGDPDQFYRQYDGLREAVEPRLGGTPDGPPRVLFADAGTGSIRLGDATVPAREFRALLAGVSTGKGMHLEYDAPGDEPASPPAWVITDVLVPTGFDRRMPSEAALDRLATTSAGADDDRGTP